MGGVGYHVTTLAHCVRSNILEKASLASVGGRTTALSNEFFILLACAHFGCFLLAELADRLLELMGECHETLDWCLRRQLGDVARV